MNRFELITRLAAVEALEGRGATAGERDAARRARGRLEERLEALVPPLPTSLAEELDAHGHLQQPEATAVAEEQTVRLPDRRALARRIAAVLDGREDTESLRRWAARLVDRVVLPDVPADDPGSVVPEVIASFAGADPSQRHLEAALRFLAAAPEDTARAWAEWLGALAGG